VAIAIPAAANRPTKMVRMNHLSGVVICVTLELKKRFVIAAVTVNSQDCIRIAFSYVFARNDFEWPALEQTRFRGTGNTWRAFYRQLVIS
jgi:hypothetical protein